MMDGKSSRWCYKMAHPKRVKGEISLIVDVDETLTTEVNHHKDYYRAIFEAMNVSAAKNHDYAGNEDMHPLGNFMRTSAAGIDPEIGLLVRMLDKVGRIETFFREGSLKVKGESVEDAFMDLGNYCFLMIALLRDKEDEE